jgi:hypothetical protein
MYKELYKIFYYLKDNIDKKYIIIGAILLVIFIFMNLSSVIWWGLLIILIYFLYGSRKENESQIDKKLETLCKKNPNLDLCKLFNESQNNHKKVIDQIQTRLSLK